MLMRFFKGLKNVHNFFLQGSKECDFFSIAIKNTILVIYRDCYSINPFNLKKNSLNFVVFTREWEFGQKVY